MLFLQRSCVQSPAVPLSGDKIYPSVQNSVKVISFIALVLPKTNEPAEVSQVTRSMTFMPFVLAGVSVEKVFTWTRIITVYPKTSVIVITKECSIRPVRSCSIKTAIAFVKVAKWFAARHRMNNSNVDQIKSTTHVQMISKLVPSAG